MNFNDLQTPCALVDLDRFEANCLRMAERAHDLGVRLRPHVKTHKCVEGAKIQTRGHFGGITVSTLAEARGFADAGFRDITYAVPLAPQRLPEIIGLGVRLEHLSVLVDHIATVTAIEELADASSTRIPVWLKIDCGLHRAGVDPESDHAVHLARRLAMSKHISFQGILTHAGQSYRSTSREEAAASARDECSVSRTFVDRLLEGEVEVAAVSIGSTPTMTAATRLDGIDEIRPGNYAFFDAYQTAIESCSVDDVAFSVLTTVVSAFAERNRAVIDAGALALSKDPGPTHVDPACGFGVVTAIQDQHPLPGLRLTSLSQEHGVLEGPGAAALRPGTRLRIFPNHSCLAAACFDRFHVIRESEVVDEWKPFRGW